MVTVRTLSTFAFVELCSREESEDVIVELDSDEEYEEVVDDEEEVDDDDDDDDDVDDVDDDVEEEVELGGSSDDEGDKDDSVELKLALVTVSSDDDNVDDGTEELVSEVEEGSIESDEFSKDEEDTMASDAGTTSSNDDDSDDEDNENGSKDELKSTPTSLEAPSLVDSPPTSVELLDEVVTASCALVQWAMTVRRSQLCTSMGIGCFIEECDRGMRPRNQRYRATHRQTLTKAQKTSQIKRS